MITYQWEEAAPKWWVWGGGRKLYSKPHGTTPHKTATFITKVIPNQEVLSGKKLRARTQVKRLCIFTEEESFATELIKVHQLSLSWGRDKSRHNQLYFHNTQIKTTLPSTPISPNLSISFGFPTKILYKFLITLMPATCSTHLIFLDSKTVILFDEEYKSLQFITAFWL